MNVSAVTAIHTQGGGGTGAVSTQWMTTYRLEYSQDCLNFNSILYVNGSNQIGRYMFCLTVSAHPVYTMTNLFEIIT